MRPFRILIVDDHDVVRGKVRSLLAGHDAWVVCGEAMDGIDAVEKARALQPDLVVMDVSMPRMNGVEAARILRQELPKTEVVIISQNDRDLVRRQAEQVDARRWVAKIDLMRELVPAVESALHSEADSGIVAWSWDLRTGLVTHSENATEILGLPRQIHVSNGFFHVYPEDVQHVKTTVQRAIENRGEYQMDFRAIRADNGKVIWLHNRGRVECDAEGQAVHMTGTTTDISDRKQAEQAKALLAAIVDFSDDAIISKSLEGIVTSWNRGAQALFGYSAEEAIGKSITLIIPKDRLQEEATILAKLRRGERIDHFETIRRRKDGTLIDISLTVSPVKDSTGRVIGASKVARDISAQKSAERALADRARQQKALFHLADQLHRAVCIEDVYSAALDSIFAGLRGDRASILLRDNQGVMRFVSSKGLSADYRRAVEGHSPWASEEMDPQPVFVNDVGRAGLSDELSAIVRAEGIASLAFIPVISNRKLIGKFMVYFDRAHEFNSDELDLSLAISRQLAFAIDRQRAEDALRRSEEQFRSLAETLDAEVRLRTKELEQRNADVMRQSEWLRDLSRKMLLVQDDERRHIARELHDSAGQTLTILAMNLARVAEDARQVSPELAQEAEETQQLVQQLSREIRTTSYLLHPPLLDESGLSAALHWYVRGLRERSGLDIELEIAEAFGRLPRDLELVVFRVVQETLTNIHRHSGSKSAQIRVLRDKERISLIVQDQGQGISAEKMAEIQSRGSGVGIRGMRERVRQFNGEMNIQSDNTGTTISVIFPAPKTTATESGIATEPLQAAG